LSSRSEPTDNQAASVTPGERNGVVGALASGEVTRRMGNAVVRERLAQMTERESWQVSGAAAEVYERCFVPAIFGQWAPELVDAARVASADRVLDVGCGTGIVARTAADRVAAQAQVVGLDINDGMLAVARRIAPGVGWQQGDATALPFTDSSFDVVMSQFALMFFSDRITALTEMRRVLKPDGRLAVAVWGPYERALGYVVLTEVAGRRCGGAAADVLTAPFVLGHRDTLVGIFRAAGIDDVAVELRRGTISFPTVDVFVETEVKGSPLEALLDEESYGALLSEARDALRPFCSGDGQVTMPLDAYVVVAGTRSSSAA
jgi:SAM-dependent methyltransferase